MNTGSKQIWTGLAVLILLAGCVRIPEDHQTLGSLSSPDLSASPADRCTSDMLVPPTDGRLFPAVALNANGFTLVNWNLLKERKSGWDADLRHLTAQDGILLLQEARNYSKLTQIMDYRGVNWDLAPAFIYNGEPVGVLTATQATPMMRCMARTPEPLLRVPKSMLITRYLLSEGESSLVVVNLHGVNFAWGTAGFRKLWQEVEKILTPHTGPLIVAGDFNTWSSARMAIVEEKMAHMGLIPVTFQNDTRSTFWGNALDHIYYRGLTQLEAKVLPVDSSDHYPLMAKFKVSNSS